MPYHTVAPASASPISNVPNEILQEIFMHCLPQHPLHESPHQRKPMSDAMAAPMLLCHICSSWRTYALASATLWTYLSYSLTIVNNFYSPSDESDAARVAYIFAERDIAFLRWWRRNQGRIAPFLRLDVNRVAYIPTATPDTQARRGSDDTDDTFLLDYITSAQYLDLNIFYWRFLRDHLQAGYPVIFPHLHTVLVKLKMLANNPFNQLHALLPAHAIPALRRLSINTKRDILPTYLVSLTHLCLRPAVSASFWHTLIRTVPHLQCGYFEITAGEPPFDNMQSTKSPPPCTHAALTTLAIVFYGMLDRATVLPLSLLFTGLNLPAVRTLALAAPGARAWEDPQALAELYTVLNATPAVTTLALEEKKLVSDNRPDPDPPFPPLPVLRDAVPIWSRTPALAHIQLALPARLPAGDAAREEALILFVRHIFASDSIWLDLRNVACPIRAVTVSHDGQLHGISELTMARVRESAGTVPEVVFELTSELAIQAAAEVRREWGSRV